MPRSWRHFQYGMAYLGRAHLRDQLAHAEAVRLAGAEQGSYRNWHQEMVQRLTPRLPE